MPKANVDLSLVKKEDAPIWMVAVDDNRPTEFHSGILS